MNKTGKISESSSVKELYLLLEKRCDDLNSKYREMIGSGGLIHGQYDHNEMIALLTEKREAHAMLASIYGLLGR